MNKKEFKLGDTTEIDKRYHRVRELFEVLFEPEERPIFVSDEATLYDVYADDEDVLKRKYQRHYGIELYNHQLGIPIWQLLDYIEKYRILS